GGRSTYHLHLSSFIFHLQHYYQHPSSRHLFLPFLISHHQYTHGTRGRVSFSIHSLHSSKAKFIDMDSSSYETQLLSISFLFCTLRIPYTLQQTNINLFHPQN
ncbi:hypothetical protein VIGAN_06171300, partial [Vigna angularis var. angularis]